MGFSVSDVVPFTQARANLSELADQAKAGAEKIITKNGESYVALIDADRLDYYHRLERERIHLLLIDDARRGLAMFTKVNVPVIGIIENMSYFLCPECGTRSDVFGHGGARHEAERLGVPFLGEIPLHMEIRATSDAGRPVVESEPNGPHATIYRSIAAKVRDRLQALSAI